MSVPVIERLVQLGEELVGLSLALDNVYSNVLRWGVRAYPSFLFSPNSEPF